MKKNQQLKPCPFCGNKKMTEEDVLFYEHIEYAVICNKCDAAGPFGKTEKQAISIWNKRKTYKIED
jgi:Lar family restriction alleviation protein